MNKVRKFINNIPKPFKNKYIILLVFFAFWITFIDDYNLIKQYQLQKDINKLKEQKEYYISEIESDSIELYQLQNSEEEQERFAREKFLMKKDNEDVFIIKAKKDE